MVVSREMEALLGEQQFAGLGLNARAIIGRHPPCI